MVSFPLTLSLYNTAGTKYANVGPHKKQKKKQKKKDFRVILVATDSRKRRFMAHRNKRWAQAQLEANK